MNPTIVRLAFSSLLGRSRSLGLLVLPALLLIICVIARVAGAGPVGPDGTVGRAVLAGLGLVVVVPILSLLVATRLLGNEMEDGTIYYLLSKPVPRWQIVTGKLLAAVVTTLLLGALPVGLCSLVLDHTRGGAALGWTAGAALAAVAYSGLFLALSSVTKHAVVWGLMYLMVWEGALGTLLSGISWLSIAAWAKRVAATVGDMEVVAVGDLGATYAVAATAVLVVAGAAWSVYKLRGLSMTGDD